MKPELTRNLKSDSTAGAVSLNFIFSLGRNSFETKTQHPTSCKAFRLTVSHRGIYICRPSDREVFGAFPERTAQNQRRF